MNGGYDFNTDPFAGEKPSERSPEKRHRFPLVRFNDIELSDTPRCVVEDLIPREGLIVVWGPPKCGKSFFVFDMVMHVALDREYRGKRVERGAIVYIAAEGELGIKGLEPSLPRRWTMPRPNIGRSFPSSSFAAAPQKLTSTP
jgi:hypothetical protein